MKDEKYFFFLIFVIQNWHPKSALPAIRKSYHYHVVFGLANATRGPRKHGLFPLCIPSLFSLGGAHCTASYTFLSILINELVHKLTLLLFCAQCNALLLLI
jgi:hypothetical protein